jgi:hypothetical protein
MQDIETSTIKLHADGNITCKNPLKLHGLSPRANYTDQATAACRRSQCKLLRMKGATWSAWRIPTAVTRYISGLFKRWICCLLLFCLCDCNVTYVFLLCADLFPFRCVWSFCLFHAVVLQGAIGCDLLNSVHFLQCPEYWIISVNVYAVHV